MEERQELLFGHPVIQAELERRSFVWMRTLLGEESKENHKAYENNWLQVKELWKRKQEYLFPFGAYSFSENKTLKEARVEEENILAEFVVVTALRQYEGADTLEQYLMHLLQISVMNAVRDYMQEVLVPQLFQYRTKKTARYVSEFYGPGLFEEPFSTMQEMLEVTKVKGVQRKDGKALLEPDMAFAGVLYVTKEPVILTASCCSTCKAKVGCEYCMKRKRR